MSEPVDHWDARRGIWVARAKAAARLGERPPPDLTTLAGVLDYWGHSPCDCGCLEKAAYLAQAVRAFEILKRDAPLYDPENEYCRLHDILNDSASPGPAFVEGERVYVAREGPGQQCAYPGARVGTIRRVVKPGVYEVLLEMCCAWYAHDQLERLP